MEWLNIHRAFLSGPAFIGSSPAERGTWVCVAGWSVGQENGGRIVGGATWKERQWQQACGVTLREVKAATKLLTIEGDDVLVGGYPSDQETTFSRKRLLGRLAANARWEKERQAQAAHADASADAHADASSLAYADASGSALPPAIRKGKERKGREGKGKEPHADSPPPPDSDLVNGQAGALVKDLLRARGMPSAPEAVEEWVPFLRNACQCRKRREVELAVAFFNARHVKYSREAVPHVSDYLACRRPDD